MQHADLVLKTRRPLRRKACADLAQQTPPSRNEERKSPALPDMSDLPTRQTVFMSTAAESLITHLPSRERYVEQTGRQTTVQRLAYQDRVMRQAHKGSTHLQASYNSGAYDPATISLLEKAPEIVGVPMNSNKKNR